ncbi:MAG TPA: carboxypeptidase-like regulatory domain-containing protein [Terriglobia bacterium]|nr:carboxypeptidase-like regulatory domain-containing protein [Terriglobia bacterium]
MTNPSEGGSMKNVIRLGFVFCLAVFSTLALATAAIAQNTNSGDIRGTVTDTSGAVVAGATVSVKNLDTGVSKDFTTNEYGIYDTVSTPPGNYNITFSKEGFKKVVLGPIAVQVAVITENAAMQVGAVTQEVTVTATGAPLLHTETGQQGHVMESKTIEELPQSGGGITGADWAAFNIYLPGAGGTTNGRVSQAGGAWNAGDAVSINGNLPNFDNFLQDGASTILPASYNNDDAIFETVAEVQVNTSSFSAQYGMGGVVFNQISKGGTNRFHGSAYEYFSNDALNAAGYFANQAPLLKINPLNPNGPEIPNPAHGVPYLRYDQYGGSIGGPIIKNKLFFFFDRDKIVNNNASTAFVTVPTAAMEQGNFAGMYPIYDPLTTTGSGATLSRTQFGTNMIPAGRIDPVAAKIMSSVYGWPLAPQGVGTCKAAPFQNECTNNLFLSHLNLAPVTRYFGRMDFNMSDKNRIMFSITQKDNPATNNGNFPCPVDCGSGEVTGLNTQVTDTWTITPTTLNEFRMGYTRQGNYFLSSTIGLDPAVAFGLQDTHFNQFPTINSGGPAAFSGLAPSTDAVYIENSFDPSDVVTMIKGKHILKFGAEVLISQGNTTAWGANNSGTYGFTGQYTAGVNANGSLNTSTAGSGFADFLLGNIENWSDQNVFRTGMRMKSPQAFVQDDWKVKPNLTVNLGLRWTGNTGMSELHNRLGNFDPRLTNNTGPFAGTLGSIWIAPQDNRTTLEPPIWNIFLPRAGFAWLVRPNTTIRGGVGFFAYNYSMDLYGGEGGGQMGFGSAFSGSNSDPIAAAGDTGWINGTHNATPLYLSSSAGMMSNALPYIGASKDPGTYIRNPVYNPPYLQNTTKPGEIWEWTLSAEHQFAHNFMASVAYVGSHGMNLQYPTALNQITNPALLNSKDISACNGATPASIAANPSTCERPYPAFGNLGGSNFNAISNYDSLQIDVRKRYGNGLSFDANYAWSHMLDSQDSAGWGSTAGAQVWQIGNNPAANYGNSNFDIPQAFKGTATYELPFGIGRTYLNHNAIADGVFGGWRLAGTFIYQSGTPFTVLDAGVNDYSQAGNVFANPVSGVSAKSGACANGATVGFLRCWFNPSAFQTPAQQGNGTFGTGGRNTLFGPKLSDVNLSIAKTWHYKERLGFTLRGDFVNALNHPSFSLPNNNVADPAVATITGVSNAARTIQLGARFSF